MSKTRLPYSPAFRRQMVKLVRTGRNPANLAREFESSSQALQQLDVSADRQESLRELKPATAADPVLITAERGELAHRHHATRQQPGGDVAVLAVGEPLVRPGGDLAANTAAATSKSSLRSCRMRSRLAGS